MVILCGDFNVFRYPMDKITVGDLFSRDANWIDYFDLLENEYDHIVKTLESSGHKIVNCWERDKLDPTQKCVTVGDMVEVDGKDGVRKPKETVLTLSIDQGSENCYDYIFEVKQP